MKVEAYRKRQESAGYVRKEVLVTQESAALLQWLAEVQGVSSTDVAGALLEYGLKQYRQNTAESSSSELPGSTQPTGEPRCETAEALDPIQAFVARRKLPPVQT